MNRKKITGIFAVLCSVVVLQSPMTAQATQYITGEYSGGSNDEVVVENGGKLIGGEYTGGVDVNGGEIIDGNYAGRVMVWNGGKLRGENIHKR